ncbi:hypothetical+protein [Methylocapsa aurea]|uniref:hypothetical protein n=1 Tax=Methylocapsa aurea TaxID=663610 RepID=UPI003D18A2D1
MSDIRDKAREILERALPDGQIITSNGATASKYTQMTGLTQKALTDNWAHGGIMTGCNGFTGWYGAQLGSKTYLGGFDLQGIATGAGRPEAWIPSTADNRPQYGDILRHASFHVDVCCGYDGGKLLRAAGGQGGPKLGYDVIKRLTGAGAYSPSNLLGWIDIDIYCSEARASADPALSWLYGWWQVWDGNYYYYWFGPRGDVNYVKSRPAAGAPAPARPNNRGRYRVEPPYRLIIDWNPVDGASTRETFWNACAGARSMNANSSRYSPLASTKLG